MAQQQRVQASVPPEQLVLRAPVPVRGQVPVVPASRQAEALEPQR